MRTKIKSKEKNFLVLTNASGQYWVKIPASNTNDIIDLFFKKIATKQEKFNFEIFKIKENILIKLDITYNKNKPVEVIILGFISEDKILNKKEVRDFFYSWIRIIANIAPTTHINNITLLTTWILTSKNFKELFKKKDFLFLFLRQSFFLLFAKKESRE